jgi:hypothetical protein
MDRPQYQGLFTDLVVLDFSLEELPPYRPFLLAMGLGKNLMSTLVEEKTMVDSGVLDVSLTTFLRSRAYALFRYAKLIPSIVLDWSVDVS